jgi:hypothetical protein
MLWDIRWHIWTGIKIDPYHFGPWPKIVCGDGDLWGYGEDTTIVRAQAYELDMVAKKGEAYVDSY